MEIYIAQVIIKGINNIENNYAKVFANENTAIEWASNTIGNFAKAHNLEITNSPMNYCAVNGNVCVTIEISSDVIIEDKPKTKEFFNITALSRDDFEYVGYDGSKLTDDEMSRIADKMADSYVANQYYIDLEYFAEEYNLPKNERE